MSVALALVMAAQPAAAAPLPDRFALACSLVGRDGARSRFAFAAAGSGDRRRFSIRPEGESRWVGEVTAASVRGRNYHFVSGGTPYRLSLEFDPQGASLTAKAELAEDRGARPLDVDRAHGSCRQAESPAGPDLPRLPPAPEIRADPVMPRPVPLREGRVPSECTVVLRDLSELKFLLDVTFSEAGAQLTVTPASGEAWPASAFTARAALLAAIVRHPSGPPGGVMTAFAHASDQPAAGTQIGYRLHAEPNMIEGWVELRAAAGGRDLVGAGHCSVRQGEAES